MYDFLILIVLFLIITIFFLRNKKNNTLLIGKKSGYIILNELDVLKLNGFNDGIFYLSFDDFKYILKGILEFLEIISFFEKKIFYRDLTINDGIFFIKKQNEILIMIGCYDLLHHKSMKSGFFFNPMHIELYIDLQDKNRKLFSISPNIIKKILIPSFYKFDIGSVFGKEIIYKTILFFTEVTRRDFFKDKNNVFNKYYFKNIQL